MAKTKKANGALDALVTIAEAREALGADEPSEGFVKSLKDEQPQMYRNTNERLNIDFTVERLSFFGLQTMDPRIVRIAPGANNEFHKHAHESLFIILKGRGEVRLGDEWQKVKQGDCAFVPRWIFHQTRNTSSTQPLVLLAVTDFGFTSAVLGNYDKRTRLAEAGAQALDESALDGGGSQKSNRKSAPPPRKSTATKGKSAATKRKSTATKRKAAATKRKATTQSKSTSRAPRAASRTTKKATKSSKARARS